MRLLKANEIDILQWEELLSNSPTKNFFQSKKCFDFYASLSFLTPFLYAIEEDSKLKVLVCGYLIADGGKFKQYFSKRAIVPGGLLIAGDASDSQISSLLQQLSHELKNKAIYIEFRNYIDYEHYKKSFNKGGFKYYEHLNFHLPTPDQKTVWDKLSKSKQRQIKSSLKAGASIVEASTNSEITEYYQLLHNLYKYKIKLPIFPVEFFEKIHETGIGKILLVKFNEEIVGGITCVSLQKEIIYEWFVCGNDGVAKQVYPSVLATWAGIEYAITNKYSYFDFMGAGKPNSGYGVFEFKSKFGGNKVEEGRFVKINNHFLFNIGRLAIKIIQSLKLNI